MTEFDLRPTGPGDLEPLGRMLSDPDDMARVNPAAKVPFDALEWGEKWLGDRDDRAFYIVDGDEEIVGFFALRIGIGPEVRHLVYVYIVPEMRGGAGERLAALSEGAAARLGATAISLKVELDNPKAHATYLSAGYEELGRSNGMATMRKELV